METPKDYCCFCDKTVELKIVKTPTETTWYCAECGRIVDMEFEDE